MRPNVTTTQDSRHAKWYGAAINALVACLFAATVLSIPWESIQGFPLADRRAYFSYFLYEENVLDYGKFSGIVDYVKSESLWHWIMRFAMKELHLSPDTIFWFISFLCLFAFAYFILGALKSWALILLVNPLLIDLALSQFRLALASSLLLLSYMSRRKVLLTATFAICIFIHTATFLFAGIYAGVWAIKKGLVDNDVNWKWVLLTCFLLGLCASTAIGPAAEYILAYVGDRRVSVYAGNAANSWKYISFWIGLLAVCSIQGDRFFRNVVNRYSVAVLSLVSTTLVTGGYTSRVLAVSLPMLIVTLWEIRPPMRTPSIMAYMLYVSFQWVYWMQIDVV